MTDIFQPKRLCFFMNRITLLIAVFDFQSNDNTTTQIHESTNISTTRKMSTKPTTTRYIATTISIKHKKIIHSDISQNEHTNHKQLYSAELSDGSEKDEGGKDQENDKDVNPEIDEDVNIPKVPEQPLPTSNQYFIHCRKFSVQESKKREEETGELMSPWEAMCDQ